MKKRLEKINLFNKNSSVLFATFAVYIKGERLPSNGMIEPILSFFLPKVKDFTLLIQPHPGSDRISPIIQLYKNGMKMSNRIISSILYLPLYLLCKIQNNDSTHISFKIRDFLSVLYSGFALGKKHDLLIGFESINALAGIMLRKFGRVNTVIYYVSDFSPKRYKNSYFNAVYLWLDAFCVEHADFTWDVSPAIKEARLQAGFLHIGIDKILHVPNGLFDSQIDSLPISKRIPESIVYMGLLNPDQHGVDLALKAFKLVLEKKPGSTFHVIGGTNRDENPFMEMVRDLGIEDSVISYGFIPPNQKMSRIINKCCIGVATYRLDKDPRNRYGDSGKIKQYLACGLPIVATTLQWYTRHVIEKGAGIGVEETPEDFARAIITLFEDQELYKSCSEKAVELSRNNTWENSYANAFIQMQHLTFAQK
ncbi:MAG: glycosyltransferase [Candidatus Parcubacteria bacterium]|nr:glycosyltransferase [Candidatus Parcubacteria bacterium]